MPAKRASDARTITTHGTTRTPPRQQQVVLLPPRRTPPSSRCRRDRASAWTTIAPRPHGAASPPPRAARGRARAAAPSSGASPSGFAMPRAGDVGRRAVHRLEEARAAVGEARGRRHAEPAGHRCGEVGEDVAEHVLGDDDVELLRRRRELHRRVVDEHVLDLHVRETPAPARRRRAATCATSRARSPCRPT